jgi:hypothetical protein
MAPICPLTDLDRYLGRSVDVGEFVFGHRALVPINNRLKSNPPPDWKTYRRRWDLLHRWRVVLLTIAFAFLIVGFVSK